MLRLDFAYIRLSNSVGDSDTEFARSTHDREHRVPEIARVLRPWLAAEAPDSNLVLANPVGDGSVSIACFRLGLQDEVGRLVVGSQRADFPTAIERLLGQVAANEAAIGLQEARHARQQRLATEELEQRVSERTQQLATVNEQLARIARVASLGVLSAAIAHEVNQPLSGVMTNAGMCLQMLDANPPNIERARETARRIVRDGNRAAVVVARLRALFNNEEFTLAPLDLNEATREVIALTQGELQRNNVIVQTQLCEDLPSIIGDRVQLQTVVVNLIRNASDAMIDIHDHPRLLQISTDREDFNGVRVTVRDAGVGIDADGINKLFDPLYTTKRDGMGIGLSVSRSIIERHHGRLWVTRNNGPGATFAFSVPGDGAMLDGADGIGS